LQRKNEGVTTITATANPKSALSYLGVSYNLNPAIVLEGQVGRYDLKDSGNDTNFVVARAIYNFSRRTAVYAEYGNVKNKGTAARSISSGATAGPGTSQNGLLTGVRHSF
ncbi:MAG: hypothetical protein JWP43_6, partial [Ramlibacter sp.]|nr:hypothetical protein [Ramlibacter sp.]